MSPLQIEILLWYYTRGADYRDGDLSAPAVRQAIDEFRGRDGLLIVRPEAFDRDQLSDKRTRDVRQVKHRERTYHLTDRGQAFVDGLLAMPLPVCRWEIPPKHIGEPTA